MSSNSYKDRHISRCQFPFSDGRRCALPLSPNHLHFCLTHALRERRLLGAEQIAAELTEMSARIRTASDLNYFLTRLVFYTASQRIPRSTARTLSYLASLLMQNIRSVKNEVTIAHGFKEWEELLRQTVPAASGESRHSPVQPHAGPAPAQARASNAHSSSRQSQNDTSPRRNPRDSHDASKPSDSVPFDEPVEVSG